MTREINNPVFRTALLLMSLCLTAGAARADVCNDRWTGAFSEDYDGMHDHWSGYCHAKDIPERSCKSLNGTWFEDTGPGYTVCHFKKQAASPNDTRDDYEYHERPPAKNVPEPYRAPTYAPPANSYVPPSPSSNESNNAASGRRASPESERFLDSMLQGFGLAEKNRELEKGSSQPRQAKQPKQRKWRALAVGIENNLLSPDRIAVGESYDYDDQESAKFRALSECRKKLPHKCIIESAWDTGCRWMYYSGGRDGVAWGAGPTKLSAASNCTANRGQECNVGPMGGCEPD